MNGDVKVGRDEFDDGVENAKHAVDSAKGRIV